MNKYKQAWLNLCGACGNNNWEDLKILDELVNKATPRTVRNDCYISPLFRELKDDYNCRSCDYHISNNEAEKKINYCPNCGQKLDWSKE